MAKVPTNRGLYVPYESMDDEPMNDTEMLKAIGDLIKAGRLELQQSQLNFAKTVGIDVKTLRDTEMAKRFAYDTTQAKLEEALGWKRGSIQDAWDKRERIPAGQLTLEEMRHGAENASWADLDTRPPRAEYASDLTDEELLSELQYRFRNYKEQLRRES